nr:MAG TPA: hypothetical protein [Crassvirales sp.]
MFTDDTHNMRSCSKYRIFCIEHISYYIKSILL